MYNKDVYTRQHQSRTGGQGKWCSLDQRPTDQLTEGLTSLLTDRVTYSHVYVTINLPILQNHVPYHGCCPKRGETEWEYRLGRKRNQVYGKKCERSSQERALVEDSVEVNEQFMLFVHKYCFIQPKPTSSFFLFLLSDERIWCHSIPPPTPLPLLLTLCKLRMVDLFSRELG